MNKFQTKIQLLKYEVIKQLIRHYDREDMRDIYTDIPKAISPGPKASMRCCVYKERAVLQERLKLALGGDRKNPNVIEVIDIACDECPIDGITVTPACRGCITHQCMESCPKNAIMFVDKRAYIDKEKCIECGKCLNACPYNAIISQRRPCVAGCKAGAIHMDENKKARIDNDKCVMCGACVYLCPFGAMQDKSMIIDVLDILKGSNFGANYYVYAVIAPSIVSQFSYAKIEQVVAGMSKLGFHQVVEAALGADITLHKELEEFKEKGTLTTSCCPSFVMYIQKNFPELEKYISESPSPMTETALLIKQAHPDAKVVFVGPCSGKKYEYTLDKTGGAVDSVLSFEELQAFFDAKDIDITALEEKPLDNASYFGRIFAKSGGICEGITALAAKNGVQNLASAAMSGLEECRQNLLKLRAGRSKENFFEGMACAGGCLNGPLCLKHGPKNLADVDKYARQAKETATHNTLKLYSLISGSPCEPGGSNS